MCHLTVDGVFFGAHYNFADELDELTVGAYIQFDTKCTLCVYELKINIPL